MSPSEQGSISRRALLGGTGAGVLGAVVTGPGLAHAEIAPAEAAYAERPGVLAAPSTRFSRMFPGIESFAPNNSRLQAALTDIGKPGGLLDAKDNLAAGPIELITNPALSANNPDNPTHTAGTTFFGQFLDHDMTFDLTSALSVTADPAATPNERVPSLNLDSVYGGGPSMSPFLYDPADNAKLKVESGGLFEDVPRDAAGIAVIGDPRNDENLIISGMHAAFLLFHNKVVDHVRQNSQPPVPPSEVFAVARRLVTWHYQWIILHEFLPQILGQATVSRILSQGRQFYRPARAEMPVEFQTGAYRFGHSMIRPSYRANLAGNADGTAFFGFIFDPAGQGQRDPVDLRGRARAPRRFIGWQTFFDFGDGEVRPNKRIDSRISTPLFNLPLAAIPTGAAPTSLMQRNLLRHLTWSLPSGQALARAIKPQETPLAASNFMDLAGYGLALENNTPMFIYILREAQIQRDGLTLGDVGGTIVGEVMIGLLQLDETAYLSAEPGWTPELPGRTPGDFRMVDLLTFAGVDPASRGQ